MKTISVVNSGERVNPFNAGINFRRDNSTFIDVKFPHRKSKNIYNVRRPGIQMKQAEKSN